MRFFDWFLARRQVEIQPMAVLVGDLSHLFVKTKVDGIAGLASVADLLTSYQKVRHADNYVRAAKQNGATKGTR